MDSTSDRELALAAAGGDKAAFARLLDRQYDRIHRLAWRLLGNPGDAEDVAQDVCVKLAFAIRGFRGEAEVSTWIWRITYNAAVDLARSRQRMRTLEPSEMMRLVESSPAAEPGLADLEQEKESLWASVRQLPGQQQEAVLLVYGDDMSHAQAAAAMGCSEKTVSWHLHEARKRLKAMLAPGAASLTTARSVSR